MLFKKKPKPKRKTVVRPTDESLARHADATLAQLLCDHPMTYVPAIEWRNLRVTAGIADYGERKIVLSAKLLTDPARLDRTLIHEYAHLLAVDRHGRRAAGHGPLWKAAMIELGQEPSVHHDYECQRNQKRQVVLYTCVKCGASIPRRRRLPKRRTFVHATCGGSLKLTAVRMPTPESATA